MNIEEAFVKLNKLKQEKKNLKIDYFKNQNKYGYEIYNKIEKLDNAINELNSYILLNT